MRVGVGTLAASVIAKAVGHDNFVADANSYAETWRPSPPWH